MSTDPIHPFRSAQGEWAHSPSAGAPKSTCIVTADRGTQAYHSYAKGLEKTDAIPGHFHVLFNEVVFDSTGPGSGKDLLPVDRALSYGGIGPGFGVPILQVHRDEPTRVAGEVLSGIESVFDSGHLELELDQRGIE